MRFHNYFIVPFLASKVLADMDSTAVRGCPTADCNISLGAPNMCGLYNNANGYPACHSSDTDFGFSDYPKDENGHTIVHFRFEEPDPGCQCMYSTFCGESRSRHCTDVSNRDTQEPSYF